MPEFLEKIKFSNRTNIQSNGFANRIFDQVSTIGTSRLRKNGPLEAF